MIWTAKQLKIGYQRKIIGFDLRVTPKSWQAEKQNILDGNKEKYRKFPASVDSQIWPESNRKNSLPSQCNGFNLFDQIDDAIKNVSQTEDSVIVAFDIPEGLANLLSPTFGLVLLPIEPISSGKAWHLIGFDIVDIRTQCSALYSFDWLEYENKDVLRKLLIKLNNYGLVQSDIDAVRCSNSFDIILPEHSPFSPCGVWCRW